MSLSFKILRLFLVLIFAVSVFVFLTSGVVSYAPDVYEVHDDARAVVGTVSIPQTGAVAESISLIFCLLSASCLCVLQHLGKRITNLEREVERLKDASCP